MKARWWWLLGVLWLSSAFAEVAVPELTQRVTDLTGTLTAPQVQALESKLAAFEAKKGSQIGVLIVPTTQPETIEQYSIRVVDKWKLGRKRVDDGVLLLVAKTDRKLRIEVGRGLEGALNDATAKRIIAEVIAPSFKQGDFAGGINAGVDSLLKVVNGEALPAPQAAEDEADGWVLAVLVGIFLFLFGSAFYLMWAKSGASTHRRSWGKSRRQRNSEATSSWSWGGSSGGSSSRSSSSDSFSSGGGDFGGGGSSGDW